MPSPSPVIVGLREGALPFPDDATCDDDSSPRRLTNFSLLSLEGSASDEGSLLSRVDSGAGLALALSRLEAEVAQKSAEERKKAARRTHRLSWEWAAQGGGAGSGGNNGAAGASAHLEALGGAIHLKLARLWATPLMSSYTHFLRTIECPAPVSHEQWRERLRLLRPALTRDDWLWGVFRRTGVAVADPAETEALLVDVNDVLDALLQYCGVAPGDIGAGEASGFGEGHDGYGGDDGGDNGGSDEFGGTGDGWGSGPRSSPSRSGQPHRSSGLSDAVSATTAVPRDSPRDWAVPYWMGLGPFEQQLCRVIHASGAKGLTSAEILNQIYPPSLYPTSGTTGSAGSASNTGNADRVAGTAGTSTGTGVDRDHTRMGVGGHGVERRETVQHVLASLSQKRMFLHNGRELPPAEAKPLIRVSGEGGGMGGGTGGGSGGETGTRGGIGRGGGVTKMTMSVRYVSRAYIESAGEIRNNPAITALDAPSPAAAAAAAAGENIGEKESGKDDGEEEEEGESDDSIPVLSSPLPRVPSILHLLAFVGDARSMQLILRRITSLVTAGAATTNTYTNANSTSTSYSTSPGSDGRSSVGRPVAHSGLGEMMRQLDEADEADNSGHGMHHKAAGQQRAVPLRLDVSPSTRDGAGNTALHVIVAHYEDSPREQAMNFKYLVGLGAPLEATNRDGFTPLHLAALLGQGAAVDVLLEEGVAVMGSMGSMGGGMGGIGGRGGVGGGGSYLPGIDRPALISLDARPDSLYSSLSTQPFGDARHDGSDDGGGGEGGGSSAPSGGGGGGGIGGALRRKARSASESCSADLEEGEAVKWAYLTAVQAASMAMKAQEREEARLRRNAGRRGGEGGREEGRSGVARAVRDAEKAHSDRGVRSGIRRVRSRHDEESVTTAADGAAAGTTIRGGAEGAAVSPPPPRTRIQDRYDSLSCTTVGCGWTALHCAAWAGHQRVVQLLLQAGARLDVISTEGVTAMDVASLSTVHMLVQQASKRHRKSRGVIFGGTSGASGIGGGGSLGTTHSPLELVSNSPFLQGRSPPLYGSSHGSLGHGSLGSPALSSFGNTGGGGGSPMMTPMMFGLASPELRSMNSLDRAPNNSGLHSVLGGGGLGGLGGLGNDSSGHRVGPSGFSMIGSPLLPPSRLGDHAPTIPNMVIPNMVGGGGGGGAARRAAGRHFGSMLSVGGRPPLSVAGGGGARRPTPCRFLRPFCQEKK